MSRVSGQDQISNEEEYQHCQTKKRRYYFDDPVGNKVRPCGIKNPACGHIGIDRDTQTLDTDKFFIFGAITELARIYGQGILVADQIILDFQKVTFQGTSMYCKRRIT